MELIIIHMAEGVNESPRLESAQLAPSAEQTDLIRVVLRNCSLGKRVKGKSAWKQRRARVAAKDLGKQAAAKYNK